MKITRLFSTLFAAGIFSAGSYVHAQDANWSQYYLNPMWVNPAFTGLDGGMRVISQTRQQWLGVPGHFPCFSVSADVQNLCISSGLGVMASSNSEGSSFLKTTQFGGLYSYRIVLKQRDWVAQAGMMVSAVNKKIDWSKLEFSDQYDASLGFLGATSQVPPNNQSIMFPDFKGGILFRQNIRNKRHHMVATAVYGFSVDHMTSPDQSLLGLDSRLPSRLLVHGSLVFPLLHTYKSRNDILFGPTVMYQQQSPMTTLQIGMHLLKLPLYAGLSYRNETVVFLNMVKSDALIVNLGYEGEITGAFHYKLAYSYDLTVSALRDRSAGTHEFVFALEFPDFHPICPDDAGSPGHRKHQDCYRFF